MKYRKWIALLAALIATYGVWQILNSQSRQKEAEMDYREVIIAGSDIKRGEIIQRSKLSVKKVPVQYTPDTALEEGREAIGKVAQSDISAGEILTEARLSDPENGQAGLSYKIPEDHRALTLTVDTEAGLAGLILPGDKVDILITLPAVYEGDTLLPDQPDGGAPEGMAQDPMAQNPIAMQNTDQDSYSSGYLLEEITVLACGRSSSREKVEQDYAETGNMYGSVTISVTKEEAQKIERYTHTAKQVNGNIRLTLRPAKQEEEASQNSDGVSDNED